MNDLISEELADILANEEVQAESTKEKKLKIHQKTYKINIRGISCKRLLIQSANTPLRPYVAFKLQGSDQTVTTSLQENTRNPNFASDTLQLDGYCVGSDLLKVLIYDCSGETPDPTVDRCIGYAHRAVSEFDLGNIFTHTFQLFKSREGKPMKDKRSREGSAGSLTCEFHFMDMASIAWKERPWGTTYYRAWVHIIGAENVPKINDQLANPYLVTKIKPTSNMQEQRTSTCIGSDSPIWNELHCYMADDYTHAHIVFKLCSDDADGNTHLLAKTSLLLAHAKPNTITSHNLSMDFPKKKNEEKRSYNEIGIKGVVLKLRVQLLPKDKIPFDGSVAFKHDLFNAEVQVIEGKEITARENENPISVVSIDQNRKATKPAKDGQTPQWGDVFTFKRVKMSQYLDVRVQSTYHQLGNLRIHLTRFPINQDTDGWYPLTDAATGQVRIRIKMTRCEDLQIHDDDGADDHCHFDWCLDINSDYSTDFTGYSECSRSLGTEISSSEEKFHYQPRHELETQSVKPVRVQSITGKLISAAHLYKWQDAKDLYATVVLFGKGREKHFKVQSNPTDNFDNPEFNLDFDFPRVKKGDSVLVVIYQNLQDGTSLPVCLASSPVKDLPSDQVHELKCIAPNKIVKFKDLKKYEGIKEFGTVQLHLKSTLTFNTK